MWHQRLEELDERHETRQSEQLSNFHTSIKDTVDIVKIEKRFACASEQHKGHFG